MNITHDALVQQARDLAPLLRETAREAELARRPLDRVIEAVRQTDLLGMMTPRRSGGLEMDLDTYFDVVLELSMADASMGWLIGFYIEHNFWYCHFPESVQDDVYGDLNYALAPASLNVTGGKASREKGGYRLSGRWQWGTGIVHASWVMVGGLAEGDGEFEPRVFLMPRDQVQAVDNWYISGMSGTGSQDIVVEDLWIPADRTQSFLDMLNGTTGIRERHPAPLYQTPMLQILMLAASLPVLGAAKMALEEFRAQTIAKQRGGAPGLRDHSAKYQPTAQAALTIESAELLMRDAMTDIMQQREQASVETRCTWSAKFSHAVFMCRDAVQLIQVAAGASGHFLDNPLQRAVRDINTATSHVAFEKTSRYGDYGAVLFEQPVQSVML